jgi:hypothetical protein
MENKQLPPGLKDELPKIQAGVKQWSQFVAWSWTDYLAFKDDQDKNPQEQALKNYFIKILQDQARYRYAVSSYEDTDKKPDAYATSLKIKKLVMGKNSEINDNDLTGITLTLPEVYEKLTNQLPESLSYEPFMKMFHVEIVTDSFSGYIRDASDAEKNEIKDFIGDQDVQYIIYFAYPPCPAFGKATVTENQLENWMQNKNQYGEEATDYLPPSAYIPVSAS